MPLILRAGLDQVKQNPHLYKFSPGGGYVLKGPIVATRARPRIWGDHPKDLCDPPAGALNESWHALKAPSGQIFTFQWLRVPKCWFRIEARAHRVGWQPAYLSSHGWTYMSAAKNLHG